MSDTIVLSQAAELECLLPQVMRSLFTLDPDHPLTDMPLAQLRLCSLLQHEPRSLSCLGELLRISPSAVTQLADRLERAGMVERLPGEDDRRAKRLRLTPYGEKLMDSRRRVRQEHAAAALERLSPETRVAVLESLRALLRAGSPDHAREAEPLTVRQEIPSGTAAHP